MRPERRAVVFDLDDTIYPYRRFIRSGFAAVADHLGRTRGLDPGSVFRSLVKASRRERGTELQSCLCAWELELSALPSLIALFRHHQPRLRLPRQVTRVIGRLREEGWRIGILTNGWPDVQARKIAALGLAPAVDAIVYAAEYGTGKPDPAPFAAVLRQLDVPAPAAVFVGDDEVCDIAGAAAAGLRAIRCTRWRPAAPTTAAHASAACWSEIPALVHRVFEEATQRHAA